MTSTPDARRRLLELRLQQRAAAKSGPAHEPPTHEAPVRASFQQESLWYLDVLEGQSDTYNMTYAAHLRGQLDPSRLERSLRVLVERHEALRTGVASRDEHPGAPMLTAISQSEARDRFRLEVIDATESEAVAHCERWANAPFDLSQPPLFRASLCRIASEHHVISLTMHHIAFDAWSQGVLLRELASLYESNGTPPWPTVVPYSAFARRQRGKASDATNSARLAYWRTQLAKIEAISLPTDRVRQARRRPAGGVVKFALSPETSARVREVSRTHSVTPFMAMYSVYALLLMRYSRQVDLCIGVPVSGRDDPEFDGTVGYFVNSLVLRADLSGDPTYAQLLSRVKRVVVDAFSNEVAFGQVVAAVNPTRVTDRNPLFQVAFDYSKTVGEKLTLAGLAVDNISISPASSKFDLTLAVDDRPGEDIRGEVEYSTDLFDRETIERLASHYCNLAAQTSASPELPISRALLTSAAEREWLVAAGTGERRAYPTARAVQQLFADRASAAPDAPAVFFNSSIVTYSALASLAQSVASQLAAASIGPEAVVGVFVERSPQLLSAVLGALKAGAAFLPLDPTYPFARLEYMVRDARVQAMLVSASLRTAAESFKCVDIPVIVVPDDVSDHGESWEYESPGEWERRAAYVIYTSGSTGEPKGVVVEHGALTNHALWICEELKLGPRDRVLQKTPTSFDASMPELFAPLISGGAIVIAGEDAAKDLKKQLEVIHDRRVTWVQWGPTELRAVLAEPSVKDLDYLHTVISGGEALERALGAGICEKLPNVRLGNFYGPTEATVDAARHFIQTVDRLPARPTVPIGHPIANGELHVLDEQLALLPVGVPGELYVGGAGLARGYLGRPNLTAERFVPHPMKAGSRLYRTGDLVRRLADGGIEHLGRIDSQVKIRGYRIELGEIESVLAAHETVRQCAVVAREDEPGDKKLVAYVVGRADGVDVATAAQLREHLGRTLPDYMVPRHFLPLQSIPVLPNGKVDRQSLPRPHESADEGARVAPRSELEVALADIWREVLGVSRIGVHDNFFDCGGHSLSATQVASRVRATFRVDVPLSTLFESQTIAQQAVALRSLLAANEASVRPLSLERDRSIPTPLTHGQEGLWFLDRLRHVGGLYNIPLALRLVGPLNVDALGAAVQALVARHESLRTVFEDHGGSLRQVVRPELSVPLPLTTVSGETMAERERQADGLLVDSAAEAFDLASGPLLRARLLRLSDELHVLQIVVHHIVSDGWSMEVMKRELGLLYGARVEGRAAPLEPLAVQFGDYAHWHRQQSRGERAETQLQYWREALRGLEPVELPTDMPRQAQATHRGSAQRITVAAELVAQLRQLARSQNATLFMVVVAAFKVLLMRYSGQEDLAVGAPVAGRDRPEFEGLIGYFLNTVVLRTDLSGNPGFDEVVARVRKTALDAYAHQEVPFETLVAELSPHRQLGSNPLFQVLINQVDGAAAPARFDGLRVSEMDAAGGDAKFPLTLYVSDAHDGLKLTLAHQVDLFSETWARVMLEQLHTLFRRIVDAPATPIGGFDLWYHGSGPERSDPSLPMTVTEHRLVVDSFRDMVRRAPESIAVCAGDRSWSYADLEHLSLALAAELEARGLQRGDVVAIHGARSPGVVTAMLATLSCGGVFLTVDPALPNDRRLQMTRTAGARWHVRVSGASLPRDGHAEVASSNILHVDSLPSLPGRTDGVRASLGQTPATEGDDAAYIFFTSGSTGQPKAVLGTHKGLAQFLAWEGAEFKLTAGDRVSNLISLSFDPILRDVFLPLTTGATLCIPEESDLLAVIDWLQRSRISLMHATPSLLQAWMAQATEAVELPDLRWTLLAGEPLADVLVQQWRRRCGHQVAVANLYGPTETTLARCFERIEGEPESGVQPVGTPIPGTEVLVLNASGVQCAVNEVGEVVIRTPFRSKGYLGLEDETRKRFRPNPFNLSDPDDLLYFTGDIGRIRPNGRLALAGRMDDQVKIRGVRVEPGEVTVVLARHEAVASAIVLPRRRDHSQYALAAYVTLRPGASVSVRELLRFLRDRLPSAYVPSTLDVLPAIPLLPNGKVDRRSLPEPRDVDEVVRYVAPRSAVEESLAELWSDVLGKARVGVEDNFFDLGGHSLAAMQLISRINSTFRIACPLRAVFEAPTISGLAPVVVRLTARGVDVAPPEPMVQVPRDRPLPVTLSQRRMWLVQQLDPATTAYNMRLTLRLRGPLDREALCSAWSSMIERHEAFRTTFAMQPDDPEPLQIIDEVGRSGAVAIQFVDLRGLHERDRQADQHLEAFLEIPFDLYVGPLHRALLIRTEEDDHRFMWVMHHAIGDDWSFGILMRELESAYGAALNGARPTLPEQALGYADFAVWQRRQFSPASIAGSLAHWVEHLRGAEPLELPVDKPALAGNANGAWQVGTPFEPALVRVLQSFSTRHNVTPFVTLLGVFQMLLARYCHQTDIVVGSPIANRTAVETESMVGTFVNTLAIRTDLSGNLSFAGLLTRLQEVALDAFAHQDVPFDLLVDAVRESGGSQPPLQIRAFFSVLNTPWEPPRLSGLDVELMAVRRSAAQFDLSISVDLDVMPGFVVALDGKLFADSSASRLAQAFEHVLRQVLEDPSRPLESYELVNDGQRRALVALNATEASYRRDSIVTDLVSERAVLAGDAPAVSSEGLVLSYTALEARANRLARALRARGVGRGALVGLCVERSGVMVVAQLAVLKAGGAYVPLDPAYPADRLAFMAEDAGLTLLVTQRTLVGVVDWPSASTLVVDAEVAAIEAYSDAPLEVDARTARPEDAAYVIYTSGSTGKPKGVVVPHRAVVNFLESMAREPGLGAHDRLVAVTTLSFDIAVLELLLPLTVGAQVVLASREQAVDGHALRTLLETSGATVMQATPATWRMLLEAGWSGGPSFKALVGGEALAPELAQQLCARTGDLWNMYGPTETTVWSTCWRVREPERGIAIGRPIANTSVWVLDEHRQLCPQGVPGEIYIGGEGVTLGYLHREALTADRFVADPFATPAAARMYRTGDRGRWRADGMLEHLGRLDFQVKVRGYRIELGEIESALAAHETVGQCVVVAREDEPGDVRLVAYVVAQVPPQGDDALAPADAAQLREHLKRTLPDYMVPQHFVALHYVPLLPNGKVDRKALPKPQDGHTASFGAYEAPSSAAEIAVAEIWQQLLGVDRVGVHDNFFDLGGHSLLVMRAVAAIEKRIGIRINPRRFIFEDLRQMAAQDAGGPPSPASAPAPAKAGLLRRLKDALF